MPLNDMRCRTAKPQEKLYRLYDTGGLYLEITPSGGRYWRCKYAFFGKERRLAIGVYPEVSLSDARAIRDRARKDIQKGLDPILLKQEQSRLAEYNSNQLFEAIAREWHHVHIKRWKPNFAKELLRRLESNLFADLGKMPINQITTPMLYNRLKAIEKRAPVVARCVRQKCGEIFRYAIQTGRMERDITVELKGALRTNQTRHRASLNLEDLPKFLEALKEKKANGEIETIAYLAVKLMLLTFPRRSELMGAKWQEIDFAKSLWTIPASRMKMGLEHLVPLSTQAVTVLKQLHELNGNRAFVFHSRTYANKPMCKTLILKTINAIGYQKKMTCHGFRALGMGIAKEKLDYRHEIPDRQLAHVPKNEIDRAYDRAKYLPQRTQMMQEIADYIDTVTNAHPSSQPMQRNALHDRNHAYNPTNYAISTSYTVNRLPTSKGGLTDYSRKPIDLLAGGKVWTLSQTIQN